MKKTIFLVVVSMVCLVWVSGAIAQPNKFWGVDVNNTWNKSGFNPIGCGGPCTWTWRTTVGAIDSATVPGHITYRFDGFNGGTVLGQRDWYSFNPSSPFDFRWHRMEDLDPLNPITAAIDAGLLIGIRPIAPGAVISEITTATFNGFPIGVSATTTVVGFGPVSVPPLGTFQAYEVRLVVTTNPNVGVIDRTRWFAPYIGVVKEVEVLGPGDVDTEVLTDLNIATVFSDVPVKSGPSTVNIFYQYIMGIYDVGITLGTGPGTYSPLSNVTREQMAAFIVRAREKGQFFEGPCTGPSPFPDVLQSSTFCRNIERLVALGITQGCGGGNYCPRDPVTREQMAAFIVRAMMNGQFFEGPCAGPSPFPDVLQSSTFCRNIEQLVNLQITKGCGNGTIYCPLNNVSREQMAAFLARAFLGIP